MRIQLLITASGEDRPGIVSRLTETFLASGANLEESRMSILGGEFAAIMLISIENSKEQELAAALRNLEKEGISAGSKKTSQIPKDRFKDYSSCRVLLKGADHEGIVFRVSSFLKEHQVNIQSADTELVHAPETGTPLFQMQAMIQVPPRLPLAELRKGLQVIASEECVDIELSETNQLAGKAG